MKVAIMGYGVVGSGVAAVLHKNKNAIAKRAGDELEIKYILDLRDFPEDPLKDRFTKDFNLILNDHEVKIVAEVMGGVHPAFEYTKALMEAGKSVVTSNKELIATKGAELLKIAYENNVNLLFEASVGGGIPVLRPIHQCLAANEIDSIVGILNGTTNYILTKMLREGREFADVLLEAQKLGYAERNPDADVKGTDACRKICILASLAFGKHVYPDNIYTEGIDNITLGDAAAADDLGYVIKLLGRALRHSDGSVFIMVSPCLVKKGSPLSVVDDVYNAILITANATEDVMFYGRGAGKLPTASAVVADMIDCAKHQTSRKWIFWEDSKNEFVSDYLSEDECMMVRMETAPDLCEKIKKEFGDVTFGTDNKNEIVFINNEPMPERILLSRLTKLDAKVISRIRVL